MKIAILGTGNLGISIAKGLVDNNAFTSLYLTKRKIDEIEEYGNYPNVFVTSDNKRAVKNSDILILAVQPTQLEKLLEEINSELTDTHIIISTITGFSISRIEELIGN